MEASKLASLLSIALIIKQRRKRRRRSLWTREWLKRNERGVFRQLMEELRLEDPEHYCRYLRMDTSTFECLLEKVEMKFTRKDTNLKEAIPAGPDNAVKVTLATLALHNFLRAKVPNRYIPKRSVDREDQLGRTRNGSWRIDHVASNLPAFPNSRKGRAAVKAEEMREILCEHFKGAGQVPWQWNTLI
ncbi:Hypothetical predicted protein [Paramuricea clavata]|uniref:Uncharacterized protein n=1 Tax=Paramuricea clavata TaxID=317549 RepID=A0A6S7IN59_PARCT|nr:Hypothetical predicted protein [Paramuricea clavata]